MIANISTDQLLDKFVFVQNLKTIDQVVTKGHHYQI